MKGEITAAQIREAVEKLKKHSIPTKIINSQEEADEINVWEKTVGLSGEWKVGDEYYVLRDLMHPEGRHVNDKG